MIVASDGSGDFTTIQEALNRIPNDNQQQITIQVKEGVYKEKLLIDKPFVTLEGIAREKVKVTYDDYALKLDQSGEKLGTFGSFTVLITGEHFTAKNITFENAAGSGHIVGQAVAVYVDADKVQFDNCALLGHQDTLFIGPLPPKPIEGNKFGGPRDGMERIVGESYFHRCYIEGDIDFIFGSGKAVFEACEIFSLNRNQEINGYITAASTPAGENYGFVFRDCRLTSNAPAETVYLGRPWRDHAKTIFINCWMGPHIKKEGWHNWDKQRAEQTTLYGEFKSKGPGGDSRYRVNWAKQLTDEEATAYEIDVIFGHENWPTIRKNDIPTIYLAGDSTVENISTDRQTTQQGWGQQLPTFFKEDIKIINKAMGGRSTKSFINEGRLLDIIESIQKNDYLFIQFGHNDQKLEDPSRGTEPWSTYQMYLTLFIEAAREKGATPILVTPVNRRSFENGKLINSLGDYPKAMRELAANLHVPLIDLFEKSRTLYEILGEENTKQLFIWYEQQHNDTPPDNTHFGEHGAKIIAELVIDGILELELDICQYLINEELKVN